MSWFDRVKMYYDKGLWSKERVYNVVGKVYGRRMKRLQEVYRIRIIKRHPKGCFY